MDRDAAVAYIARRLGNRTDLDDAIAAEIQLAQTELEHGALLPWFLLNAEQYTTLAAGTVRLELPTGFLREYEEGALWWLSDDATEWQALKKVPIDTLRAIATTYSSNEEAVEYPLYYSIVGDYFHLAPTTTVDCTLRIACYTAETALTAGDSTNDWLTHAPEVLLAKTGMRMAQYLAAPNLAQMFAAQFVEAMRDLERHTVAREVAGSELVMGGS